MGKKTFEEIGKILLVSLISILISVTATRRTLIDKKLDKEEFKEYKNEHNDRHDRDSEDIKEVKAMVQFLYENEIENCS